MKDDVSPAAEAAAEATPNLPAKAAEPDIKRQPGLSAKAAPVGWGDIKLEFDTSGPKPRIKPAPRLGLPGHPTGINKLWRYFRAVLTMLRRPAVVSHPPIHLQMESTDACNLHCMSCSRDLIVKRAKLLDEEKQALWRLLGDEEED